MTRLLPLVCIALLVTACQPATRQAEVTAPTQLPESWPEFDYAGTTGGEGIVYRLDSSGSHIDVIARRDGPMARFGHDHVITVQAVEGYLLVRDAIEASRADLRFDTRLMRVDDAERRARYELDTEPDEEAVAATRKNMLEKVIKADQWPEILLSLSEFREGEDDYSARLKIRAGGGSHDSRQSFALLRSGEDLVITGKTELSQSALGLEPFSVLGGGLRVADALEIHFRLRAVLLE